MNLQLSQTPSNPDDKSHPGLILPMLPRDAEVLQSLVRLCINVPYTKDYFKETLQSNGLYALAVCFNPTLLKLNGYTILDLDVINLMMILTASMPMLIKDASLGSLDHHVIKFCAIICLIQILAGLKEADSEEDPEEPEVQKMAKWISEVIGSSDKVLNKAAKVRKSMIRFLRCSALFFHYATGISLPMLEESQCHDDHVVYAALSEYLSLPKTLRELINHLDTFDIVNR